MTKGKPDFAVYDNVKGEPKFHKFKDNESARVETVRIIGDEYGRAGNENINYTIRY